MRILLSLLAVIFLAIFVATASAAAPQAPRNDDADRVVHTMGHDADLLQDDDPNPDNFEYEPVTILGGRLALPDWAVSAFESLTGRRLPRTFKPAPHDAPVSPRAPLLLPSSLHPIKNKMKRYNDKDEASAVVDGEWLVLVGKRHRDDFVAVLEEMGHHLASRFGLGADQWFDVGALRAAKRAHEARQQRREEQRPWSLQARSEDGSQQAVELDGQMMVQVTVPAALRHRQDEIVDSLRDKPWVEFIEPNVVMRTTATQTLSSSSSTYPWGLDRIDQRYLPLNERYDYVTPTSGVRVYVIDTGILTTHVEFDTGRAVWGTNTVGDGKNYDCYGHGTHVAGIVAGTNVGVAKDVTVVAVKALDCTGSGTAGTVSQGIAWVISDCPSGTSCIISLSLGGEQSSVMDSAVKAAYNNGIVVVSAAGNSNIDACTVTPARSPYGITVGATDSDDSKAFFSNWGGCVNIWAPGVYIPSAYFTSNTAYQKLSGTSQATPHVTGSVALYLGATKKVTPSEAAGAIYASATLNTVTGTGSSSINRFLYSQVDRGVVPTTAADACSSSFPCTSVNGSLSGLNSVNVPSGQITVTSTVANYGYLQAWLEATADFDLRLQFYNTSTLAWVNVATSTGGTGSEWIQFATSATGAGKYRFQIFSSSVALSGTYQFSYQVPSTAQAGKPQTAASASAVTPFWLSLLRAFTF